MRGGRGVSPEHTLLPSRCCTLPGRPQYPFWSGQGPPARHSPVYPWPSRKLMLTCLPSPSPGRPVQATLHPPPPHPHAAHSLSHHRRGHSSPERAGLGGASGPLPQALFGASLGVWTALLYLQQLKVTFLPGLSYKHSSSSSFKTARFPCKCLCLSPTPFTLKISPHSGEERDLPLSLQPLLSQKQLVTQEKFPPTPRNTHTHTPRIRKPQGALPRTLALRRVRPHAPLVSSVR